MGILQPGTVRRKVTRLRLAAALALAAAGLAASPALAVPSFAVQTGEPCQSCHVGGFGPQLTPFGRNFKLHGYTDAVSKFTLPLSAMAVASYVNTKKSQSEPPAAHFDTNDNFAVDQVSVFLAGNLGSHFGAFVQTTYDGVERAYSWDNLDLRAATTVYIRGNEVLLGASLNNSPTVQDAWNTTAAWGYPYTASGLVPSPEAAPLISGALAQTSLGLTGYAWVNSQYYIEAGAYGSPDARSLRRLGADPTSPGKIHGLAPYGRLAYQHAFEPHTVEIGLFALKADVFPGLDRSAGTTDDYRDLGVDVSDQMQRANGDVITLNGRYTDERQNLKASYALGTAEHARNTLREFRLDASYYWRNQVGATVQLFDTRGSTDAVLYESSRTLKPDASGMTLQLDETPFGARNSPLGPRLSLRVGVQYTMYSKFMGARSNYDGEGANASDNNTLRVFTWLAF